MSSLSSFTFRLKLIQSLKVIESFELTMGTQDLSKHVALPDVCRRESVGRFCIGNLNQVNTADCDELKAYVKAEIEKYLGD